MQFVDLIFRVYNNAWTDPGLLKNFCLFVITFSFVNESRKAIFDTNFSRLLSLFLTTIMCLCAIYIIATMEDLI